MISGYLPELYMGLSSLLVHKLRSLLTMLGMIFGVGAVVAMLSITAGVEKEMLAMIDGQSPPVFPAEDGEVRRNRPGRRCPGVVECRRSSGEARQMRHRRMRTESIAGAYRVEKNENDVALRA